MFVDSRLGKIDSSSYVMMDSQRPQGSTSHEKELEVIDHVRRLSRRYTTSRIARR